MLLLCSRPIHHLIYAPGMPLFFSKVWVCQLVHPDCVAVINVIKPKVIMFCVCDSATSAWSVANVVSKQFPDVFVYGYAQKISMLQAIAGHFSAFAQNIVQSTHPDSFFLCSMLSCSDDQVPRFDGVG